MAKKKNSYHRAKQAPKGTNWLLIGGIAAAVIAVGALFFLLFQSLQAQDSPRNSQPLAEYCLENPDNCVSKGSAEAPVTVVEVSDYGCPACASFNLNTAPLIEDLYVQPGQVHWIVLPYALYPERTPATEASMCAADQDAFFEFHARMFEIQNEPQALTTEGFQQAAEDLGLDMEEFNSCIGSGKYEQIVQDNVSAATAAGVKATPSFFINDVLYKGAQPLSTFQQVFNGILGGG